VALSANTGSFNWSTAAAGTDIVVTSVGFQPKVLILWMSGTLTTSGEVSSSADDMIRSIGFATGTTNRYSAGISVEDGPTTMNTARFSRDSGCLSASATQYLDFVSFDSDGFTVEIDPSSATLGTARRVNFLALGGSGITNATVGTFQARATTGTQTVSPGFESDAILFLGAATTTVTSSLATAMLCFGAAKGSTLFSSIASYDFDNIGTSSCESELLTDAAINMFLDTGTEARATVSAVGATDFTVNWTVSSGIQEYYGYLAIEGIRIHVGDFLMPADTNNFTETGTGFIPKAVLAASHFNATGQRSDNVFGIGAATSASQRRSDYSLSDHSAAVGTVILNHTESALLQQLNTSASVTEALDLVSFDSDGMTLVMDNAGTGTQRAWYIAFGADESMTPYLPYRAFHHMLVR
jgi:hypothetical protein